MLPGSEEVPCNKPVPVSLSEDPCCPLHFQLPPQMYKPEQVLSVPDDLEAVPWICISECCRVSPLRRRHLWSSVMLGEALLWLALEARPYLLM